MPAPNRRRYISLRGDEIFRRGNRFATTAGMKSMSSYAPECIDLHFIDPSGEVVVMRATREHDEIRFSQGRGDREPSLKKI
jgi:hypothetical protein